MLTTSTKSPYWVKALQLPVCPICEQKVPQKVNPRFNIKSTSKRYTPKYMIKSTSKRYTPKFMIKSTSTAAAWVSQQSHISDALLLWTWSLWHAWNIPKFAIPLVITSIMSNNYDSDFAIPVVITSLIACPILLWQSSPTLEFMMNSHFVALQKSIFASSVALNVLLVIVQAFEEKQRKY